MNMDEVLANRFKCWKHRPKAAVGGVLQFIAARVEAESESKLKEKEDQIARM